MPEIKRFIVEERRRVEVTANSAADAIRIADAAFTHGQNSGIGVRNAPEGVWGNTSSKIRQTELRAEEA